MAPLKIVFAIKAMRLPGGGAERVLAVVTAELARRGHDVTLISRDPPGTTDYHRTNVSRIRMGSRHLESASRAMDMLRWVPALRRLIKSLQPDVAVGFMHSTYLPMGLALRGTGIPMVASEHTVYEHYSSRRVERLLLQTAPALVDVITVVSQQARDSFPSGLRRRMVVVSNPVSSKSHAASERGKFGRRLVVAIGRLDHAKDHACLIAAFASIADAHPAWDLAIAGEGECRQALEAQISDLGLGQRVRLLGAVSDVDGLLSEADVFAMASRYESFGLATAEALMHSIPAIGFADCPGTNELIVDRHNGLLVDPRPDRVANLADALLLLFKNDALRVNLGANGPNSIAQYDVGSVVDRWEEILRAALKTPQLKVSA
ncbi:MAG: glycosyltransferase family 4 protein [Citromicrobium sp.]|nr:MAG: glycosyltransferase family 4 protein [Citromicrobium sp.]